MPGLDLENIADGGQVAVWVLAGLSLALPRVYEPNRRQRLIWKFNLSSGSLPKIIIEPVPSESTSLYNRPSTGFGSVLAVAQLTQALNASRRGFFRRTSRSLQDPIEICFSSDQVATDWMLHGDTVLVGGPKHNNMTELVLSRYGCQSNGSGPLTAEQLRMATGDRAPSPDIARGLGVATLDNSIFFFGERYDGSVRDRNDEDEPIRFTGTDYGVVLRVPSLFDPRHRMIVVFGSQTFGIQAAASWLVNVPSRSTPRATRGMMRRHRNIAALVRVDVHDGIVGGANLVELVPLPEHLALEQPA